jgi:GH25 family lysozyme M1 (1,4-beta-N-acetylmuramidase)
MTAMADTFCSMVEAAGYKAMVYANTYDWERYQASSLTSHYASWLARYPANYNGNGKRFQSGDGIPSLSYPYQIWQYSDSGQVKGISGNVDMNVAFIGFSGTSTPSVPMIFETPQEEYHIKPGISIDILNGVKCLQVFFPLLP